MQTLQEKYMYNPFLEYGDELEVIINEKGYTADIANMLRLSVPVMLEYYGHDYGNVFFNALRKVNIEIPEDGLNMYDIVQKYTPSNIEKRSQVSAVNEGDLKRASGVHNSTPIFEVVDGKVVLVGKSQVVAVKRNNNILETLATFVHELSHAFKSSQNSMNLLQDKEGNQILVSRRGLIVVYSKVYIEDGKIVIEDIEERNVGLEEGINTNDENNIINKILSLSISELPDSCKELRGSLKLPNSKTEYDSGGYVQERRCANRLLTECKMEQTVRQDQFIGTDNCKQRYNSIVNNPQNTWEQLNAKVDLSFRHTLDRYQMLFSNPGWFKEHEAEIIGNVRAIHSMLDECAQNQNEVGLSQSE